MPVPRQRASDTAAARLLFPPAGAPGSPPLLPSDLRRVSEVHCPDLAVDGLPEHSQRRELDLRGIRARGDLSAQSWPGGAACRRSGRIRWGCRTLGLCRAPVPAVGLKRALEQVERTSARYFPLLLCGAEGGASRAEARRVSRCVATAWRGCGCFFDSVWLYLFWLHSVTFSCGLSGCIVSMMYCGVIGGEERVGSGKFAQACLVPAGSTSAGASSTTNCASRSGGARTSGTFLE